MTDDRSKFLRFILDNSLFLLAGTVVAVVWANVDWDGYDAVAHPLHFWVNDVGMLFFFALAAKEVFEATLPGGHWRLFGLRCLRWLRLLVEWLHQR
jgi:Na+:H+ antiporter, NhaA family